MCGFTGSREESREGHMMDLSVIDHVIGHVGFHVIGLMVT